MANISVVVDKPIADGYKLKFRTPCESTTVEGLEVKYPANNGVGTLIKKFTFQDAHGTELSGVGNLFVSGVMIEVLLDVTHGVAYIKNADTNSYLESVKGEVKRLAESQKEFLSIAGKAVEECESASNKYKKMVETTSVANVFDHHNSEPMSVWVGTKAEYDAIKNKEPNRLYLLGDDEPLALIDARLTAIEGNHTRSTYKSLKELGITEFPTTMETVVKKMPKYSMLMMDTRHIKKTEDTDKDKGDQIISDWGNERNGIAIIMKGLDEYRVSLMVVYSSGTANAAGLDYGNYAGYNKNVNWATVPPAPAVYVVEQVTGNLTGEWSYRKWNDGMLECWVMASTGDCVIDEPWGAMYISAETNPAIQYMDYPVAFKELPVVTATIQQAVNTNTGNGFGAFLVCTTPGTKTRTPEYELARGVSSDINVIAPVHIHAQGRWK